MLVPRRIVGCRRNQQKKSGENDRTLHRSWRIDEKPGLRRLLQACIDFLQTEAAGFWKNASITIYDEDDNMYKIASGTRKHQFICRMKNGEPFIKEKKSVSEHKKPKPNHKTSTETTHHPSQKGQDHSCSVC